MADLAEAGSEEAATRAVEEQAFYHEAALNAAWTGSRLAIGGLSFLFGAFAFAYFYLQSANSHQLWLPSSTTPPHMYYGALITGLIVVSAIVQTVGLQRIKAGKKNPWARAALAALVLGVSAVALQIAELLNAAVPAGPVGLRQCLRRVLPGRVDRLALRDDMAGDIVHACSLDTGDLVRRAAAHLQ